MHAKQFCYCMLQSHLLLTDSITEITSVSLSASTCEIRYTCSIDTWWITHSCETRNFIITTCSSIIVIIMINAYFTTIISCVAITFFTVGPCVFRGASTSVCSSMRTALPTILTIIWFTFRQHW